MAEPAPLPLKLKIQKLCCPLACISCRETFHGRFFLRGEVSAAVISLPVMGGGVVDNRSVVGNVATVANDGTVAVDDSVGADVRGRGGHRQTNESTEYKSLKIKVH